MHQLSVGIDELKQRMLVMGGLVQNSIQRSLESFVRRDEELALQVLNDEPQVNDLEIEIDARVTRLFALQQPVARDLRFLTVALKINTDLERIGDLAVTIARRSLSLLRQPPIHPPADIPHMAALAQAMLQRSLEAFVNSDAAAAGEVLTADDEVDTLRDSFTKELVALMYREPTQIEWALDLLFITRSLERIADHATNIAEDVVFLVRGIDVRHNAQRVA